MKAIHKIMVAVLLAAAIGACFIADGGKADGVSDAARNVLVPPGWPPITSTTSVAAEPSDEDPVFVAARNVLVPADWPPIPGGVLAGVSHEPEVPATLSGDPEGPGSTRLAACPELIGARL